MPQRRKRGSVARVRPALLAALVVGLLAPNAAEAAWLTPQALSTETRPLTPELAMAPSGKAIAAWALDRSAPATPGFFPIFTSVRNSLIPAFKPAGRAGSGAGVSGTRYKVAISNFEAALVWGQLPGGLVQAAVRLGAGSEFGPPVQANDGSLLPSDVLGFTRNGATIFYVGNTLRARWPNPTPFSPPLPPLRRGAPLDVRAVGPNGDALVADGEAIPRGRLALRVLAASGSLSRAETVARFRCTPAGDSVDCDLNGFASGVDARGNALAVWSLRTRGRPGRSTIRWAYRPAGRRFTTPRTLASYAGTTTRVLGMAMNFKGDSVTWLATRATASRTAIAVFRPVGDRFRAPQSLPFDGTRATFAVGQNGQAAGLGPSRTGAIVSTYRRRGSRFTPPAAAPIVASPVSGRDEGILTTIKIVIDPSGTVVAVWPRSTGVLASFYTP